MEPASTIIQKCGGHARVAEMTKRHITRVHRWTYARGEKGGTGGLIPSDVQPVLLQKARDAGIDLTPGDFFPGYAP